MSKETILNLLRNVNYPGFSRDIVSFGLVQLAEMDGHTAKVILELSTADQTLPSTIKKRSKMPSLPVIPSSELKL